MLALGLIAFCSANAAIHDVEVGGGPGGPNPYYSPQNITIQVGDTVRWTWVSGQHNVTSTSGPESFSSGDNVAPFVWERQFTVAGVYDYECTLFNHSTTQFGSITVEAPNGIPTAQKEEVQVHPTLASAVLNLDIPSVQLPAKVKVYEMTSGHMVKSLEVDNKDSRLGVADLARGVYIVEIIGLNEEIHHTKVVLR